MKLKSITFYLIVLFSSNIFSQQKANISGKITAESKALTDVIIELQINKTSKFAVANDKGFYKFSNIETTTNDNLLLKVKYLGYKLFEQQLTNLQVNNVVDINLVVVENELKEVIIDAKEKIIETARKTSYKIDQKDFIKNTKAPEVLATVPNLYVDKSGEGIIVDGKLEGKLFIDGIEAMSNELKTIDAADIDRVEVMNNPSGAYGADFLGAVVNIITKKKKEEFIKGSLGATGGARNSFWGVAPSFSYKRGRFTMKSNFDYKQYNQIVDYSLIRFDNNNSFIQNSIDYSKGVQTYFQTKINIKTSEKSNLTISGFQSGYKFVANANGNTLLNNNISNYFTKNGESYNKQWNIASVYSYKIFESKKIFLKNTYAEFDTSTINNFSFNNTSSDYYSNQSKNRELTTNIAYEAEDLKFFKKGASFYTDLKYINRNYSFSDTDYYINQKVINLTGELDNEWSEKFSTETALTLENTTNNSNTSNQNYNLALPTFNALYHFKNKYDAKFSYSRKILRPSVSNLNDEIIVLNPGIAKQGNSNLDPQIRNYFAITLNKTFKSDNISVKIFNESINNSIEEVYKTQGTLLVQTLENAAKYSSTGMNFGLRTKLFKKINANLNSGFDYSIFEDTSPNAVIKNNSGYTFTGNINLSTKLFKDKVSVSFSGRQNNPDYSLLSKRITEPYLDFSLNTNLLKDNLVLNIYAKNLLGYSAAGFTDISSYNNFYQRIDAYNNSTNLLLTLTYNFGKTFNDKIDDNTINNDDVRR